MTIPTTNVSFSSLQAEFGGTNPISLSEYYRGGVYVPSDTATSAVDGTPITAVPPTSPIRLGMFRGVAKITAMLKPSGNGYWYAEDQRVISGAATAGIYFNSNGSASASGNFSPTAPNWYAPTTTGIGASYWIRATRVSGATPGGTLNQWLSLTSTRSWTLQQSSTGTKQCTLTFAISTDSAGTNIVATYTGNTILVTFEF